jgi:hypothetical protein
VRSNRAHTRGVVGTPAMLGSGGPQRSACFIFLSVQIVRVCVHTSIRMYDSHRVYIDVSCFRCSSSFNFFVFCGVDSTSFNPSVVVTVTSMSDSADRLIQRAEELESR